MIELRVLTAGEIRAWCDGRTREQCHDMGDCESCYFKAQQDETVRQIVGRLFERCTDHPVRESFPNEWAFKWILRKDCPDCMAELKGMVR